MSCPTLTIESQGRGKRAKSRSFSARLLGYLTADGLWSFERLQGRMYPVWLSYFGSDQEVRAVTANLRAGKLASTGSLLVELPKSAGFRWQAESVAGGVVVTAWLPWLFALESPGSSEWGASFVFAPPRWWLDAQAAELVGTFGAEAREVARAALFAAYLDRRTEVPLLPDLAFRLRLYRAAIEQEWVSSPRSGSSRGLQVSMLDATERGLEDPLAVHVPRPCLEAFLIEQSTQFLQEERLHGTTRSTTGGRLLPNPEPVAVQHCLDFGVAAAGG